MIDNILKSINNIPTFPVTVLRISELLRDEDYSVSEVVDLIKYDQAIAANIIRMSNSAYLSVRQKINTIRDAVVYLGRNNLIRVIQTAGVTKYFRKAPNGYSGSSADLWEHSVAVAIMSQILARKINNCEDESLYLVSLIHDIGKLLMGEFVNSSFNNIRELVNSKGLSFLEAEEQVIGINHAELGGKMALQWNFPPEIANILTYHHRPDLMECCDENQVWLVYLADQICMMTGFTGGGDDLAHRGLSEVMKKFNFFEKDLEMGMIQLVEDLTHARDLMEIK